MYDKCALKVKINNGKLKLRHLKCPDACCLLHGVVNMIKMFTLNCTLCRYKFCFRLFNLKLLTTKTKNESSYKANQSNNEQMKTDWLFCDYSNEAMGAELSTTK